MERLSNKQKIINDPVYGFINIPNDIVFDLIEHPFFQRLRRIKQLGLSHLVYPGALHTRFHHAMGAMHLMILALNTLRKKGLEITKEEYKAAIIAILLHDIGHGPFSHSLENKIIYNLNHEALSKIFMKKLNKEFNNELDLAIKIFSNSYKRKFLSSLINSQLDVDRMDYLKRDCFYTGVTEGNISSDRIIDMLNAINDDLVVEIKGIYSIESFIIARRLMYWQVYFHKTVISAEKLLINIIKRASFLAKNGENLFATPAFKMFLYNSFTEKDFLKNENLLILFAELDDNDIMTSIKVWANHSDRVLSNLCKSMVNRRLLKVRLSNTAIEESEFLKIFKRIKSKYNYSDEETSYFVFTGKIKNNAYDSSAGKINILMKDKSLKDITEVSDYLNASTLSEGIEKHFVCFPNN